MTGQARFRNRNRGYQKLVVWGDAVAYYTATCSAFCRFPFELKKVASQQIAAADSVHRNIAEGYCRRSIKEYLHFLNIALASLGESVSGLHVYATANQIEEDDFTNLDAIAYKLENGLLKLIEALERKKASGDWNESLIVSETNAVYSSEDDDVAARRPILE